jgi:hypothetical protein
MCRGYTMFDFYFKYVEVNHEGSILRKFPKRVK